MRACMPLEPVPHPKHENLAIDCNEEGSLFRLLHHACAQHAVVKLVTQRISGFYSLSVIAATNIATGILLTVYVEDGKNQRECCLCGRIG